MKMKFDWDPENAEINLKKQYKIIKMREEYDFSNAVKNPYVGKLKHQITIRLDEQVIDYFKKMSEETGMPYQNIINYYLLDCVKEKKHMEVAFAK